MIFERGAGHQEDNKYMGKTNGWKIKKRDVKSVGGRDGVKIGMLYQEEEVRGSRHGEFKKLIDGRIETQWNRHWKITDGETVAGQASQGFVENGV